VGMIVSSLHGDNRQLVGRLEQDISVGTHTVQQPVVDLTEQLSSLGGELLRHFRITFDQQRHTVTMVRDTDGAVEMPGRRSTGLSFRRFPNYWRLLAVVPDTPNSSLSVQPGDLCVRINGELVEKWTFERYSELVKTESKITYTFLSGSKETDHEVQVFELVP
jgi:C-terminal processing protease CtpA/Prc